MSTHRMRRSTTYNTVLNVLCIFWKIAISNSIPSIEMANEPIRTTGGPRILQLPTELLVMIIAFVTAPSDLKRVCLTCRDFHTTGIEQLYHTIRLDLEDLNPRLNLALSKDNPGMKYVRNVDIKSSRYSEFIVELHMPYFEHLLRNVHLNHKKEIWITGPYGLTASLCSGWISRRRQCAGENILDPSAPQLPPPGPRPDMLQHLTSLTLLIRSENDISCLRGAFKGAINLRSLSVAIDHAWSEGLSVLSIETLFWDCAHDCSVPLKLGLSRLYLAGFDLRLCSNLLVDGLSIARLEELTLRGCSRTDKLMDSLCRDNIELNLTLVANIKIQSVSPESPCADKVLQKLTGLRQLRRTYEPKTVLEFMHSRGLSWKSIEAHASTLELLLLDDTLEPQHQQWKPSSVRPLPEFAKICPRLTRLKQLAIRTPNADFEAWDLPNGFIDFLRCLKQIPKLTSLKLFFRLSSLRDLKAWEHPQPILPDVAEREIQELAARVFLELGKSCSMLTALVLKAQGSDETRLPMRWEKGWERGFVRSWFEDFFGTRKATATPIEVSLIKYQEPCSEIFYEL